MDFYVPAFATLALTGAICCGMLIRALVRLRADCKLLIADTRGQLDQRDTTHFAEMHALRNDLHRAELLLEAERTAPRVPREIRPLTPLTVPPLPPPVVPLPPPPAAAAGIPVAEVLQIMAAMAADRQAGYEVMARVISTVTAAATAPFITPAMPSPPGPPAMLGPQALPTPWYASPFQTEAYADPTDASIPPVTPRTNAFLAGGDEWEATGIEGFAWAEPTGVPHG